MRQIILILLLVEVTVNKSNVILHLVSRVLANFGFECSFRFLWYSSAKLDVQLRDDDDIGKSYEPVSHWVCIMLGIVNTGNKLDKPSKKDLLLSASEEELNSKQHASSCATYRQ